MKITWYPHPDPVENFLRIDFKDMSGIDYYKDEMCKIWPPSLQIKESDGFFKYKQRTVMGVWR